MLEKQLSANPKWPLQSEPDNKPTSIIFVQDSNEFSHANQVCWRPHVFLAQNHDDQDIGDERDGQYDWHDVTIDGFC